MANSYFQFKLFRIEQARTPMKVCTDACILGALSGSDQPGRILDIGCGTALLALMLAQRHSCPVDAVEQRPGAYADAEMNVANSLWHDRINLFFQRIQDFDPGLKYDLIVCNPPFFTGHKKSPNADKNSAGHNDNLPFSDLTKSVLRLLSDKGKFFILLPPHEWSVLNKMLNYAGFYLESRCAIRNFPENAAFRIVASYAFRQVKPTDRELIIKNNPTDYTREFKDLLRPFYLNF